MAKRNFTPARNSIRITAANSPSGFARRDSCLFIAILSLLARMGCERFKRFHVAAIVSRTRRIPIRHTFGCLRVHSALHKSLHISDNSP